MNWFSLFTTALATWQIIEIWRHSEITGRGRAVGENWELSDYAFVRFWGRLAACAFCLSVWCAEFVGPVLVDHGFTAPWLQIPATILRWLAFGLAASRLANLGNDLTYQWSRTTKHDQLLPDSKAHLESNDDESQPSDVRCASGGDHEDGGAIGTESDSGSP